MCDPGANIRTRVFLCSYNHGQSLKNRYRHEASNGDPMFRASARIVEVVRSDRF